MKRLLAIILAFSMLIGILPTVAFAEGETESADLEIVYPFADSLYPDVALNEAITYETSAERLQYVTDTARYGNGIAPPRQRV